MMRRTNSRRGSALLICTILTLVVISVSGAYVTVSQASARQTSNAMFGLQALYTAEAGVATAVQSLLGGGTGAGSGQFGNGQYQTSVTYRDKDGLVTSNPADASFLQVDTTGTFSGISRRVQVILARQLGGPWYFALYAGNSSNDPNYTLTFGGKKTKTSDQADKVWGDVYSGGNLSTADDAQLLNLKGNGPSDLVMYNGTYNPGSSQGTNPNAKSGQMTNPDLAAMNYEARAKSGDPLFVDVAAQLKTYGKRGKADDSNGKSGDDGGYAIQIKDENIESHIFRLNPENRTSLTSGTAKNDYFLEDPTQPIRVDPNINGTDAYQLRISPNGNQRIYFVDGNLWVNHLDSYSFKFKYPERDGIQVTFVVKGNVYLGDNLYYNNKNKDSVAFIALKDPSVADSGNIYFGDPIYGTTERFESFLYAENNFYDNNIGSSGSMSTNIYGNMSAGNQVRIKRNLSNGQYAKLTVQFDERIKTGEYVPPGLPDTASQANSPWVIAAWRQLP